MLGKSWMCKSGNEPVTCSTTPGRAGKVSRCPDLAAGEPPTLSPCLLYGGDLCPKLLRAVPVFLSLLGVYYHQGVPATLERSMLTPSFLPSLSLLFSPLQVHGLTSLSSHLSLSPRGSSCFTFSNPFFCLLSHPFSQRNKDSQARRKHPTHLVQTHPLSKSIFPHSSFFISIS